MNNSMERKNNLKSPESIITLIPIVISSGIAILLIIFYLIPQYIKSNKVNLELNDLIKKKNDLDGLKVQYKIINQKFDKLSKEKAIIIETISGSSNLDTLAAKLGELAKKNNIKFDSIVPKQVIKFVNNSSVKNNNKKNNNKKNNLSNLNIDPLLVEGVKKYLIDFSFKTNFNNLLSFLRELEFQENIILLDDIDLKLSDQNIDNSEEMLKVKIRMTFYGKI